MTCEFSSIRRWPLAVASLAIAGFLLAPACGPQGGDGMTPDNTNMNDDPNENDNGGDGNLNDNSTDGNENTNDNSSDIPCSEFQLTEMRYAPSAQVVTGCSPPDSADLLFEGIGGQDNIEYPATVTFSVLVCEDPCDLSAATLNGAEFTLTEETGLIVEDAVECVELEGVDSYSITYEATMTDACGDNIGSAPRQLLCCRESVDACRPCP